MYLCWASFSEAVISLLWGHCEWEHAPGYLYEKWPSELFAQMNVKQAVPYYNSIIKVLLLYVAGCLFAEQIRLYQQCLYFLAVDLGDLSLLTKKILVDLSLIPWWEHQSIVIICLQLIMTRQAQVLYTVWWCLSHNFKTNQRYPSDHPPPPKKKKEQKKNRNKTSQKNVTKS